MTVYSVEILVINRVGVLFCVYIVNQIIGNTLVHIEFQGWRFTFMNARPAWLSEGRKSDDEARYFRGIHSSLNDVICPRAKLVNFLHL